MSNPSQLFLLADHIKLSLLESRRDSSLLPDVTNRKDEIQPSLDSLKSGITALAADTGSQSEGYGSQVDELWRRYNTLLAAYQDHASPMNTIIADTSTSQAQHNSIGSPRAASKSVSVPHTSKAVRFSDNPSESESDTLAANRKILMPYRDDPSDHDEGAHQQSWSNQQIHKYHKDVLGDQDEQLDRLGTSIGRQRELSIQIGNELEDQVEILDDLDDRVTRHQTQLDRAKTRLTRFAKKAKDNLSLTVIGILVLILVLLLIILK